ncbi:DNA-processing protein DprA [Candidatus Saccharibacteria bacterium]|nr:DNA-processing protein DprA [Candidatus Saccharibacteria bacterium]
MSTLFSHFFQKFNQIRPLEANFTEVLESIAVKPKLLYFYGKMPENVVKFKNSESNSNNNSSKKSTAKTRTSRPKTVAIVGARKNTRYGEEVAYKISYELAKRGVIIVSGLAFGIDSIAHRAALDAGGTTVAVLGTPIDEIYPRQHEPLAREIVDKGGAIISEYAPRTAKFKNAPLAPGEYGLIGGKWLDYRSEINNPNKRRIDSKTSFLFRNRLVSGLADVVVVVEAAEKSGSLSTAAHAIEQGREVFAVPGNITSPLSQGCNKLIRQGANPYTELDDILRILFPEELAKKRKKPGQALLFGDSEEETNILKALSEGLRNGEEIMQTLNLPASTFNETITLLEIKGFVRSLGANNWTLG